MTMSIWIAEGLLPLEKLFGEYWKKETFAFLICVLSMVVIRWWCNWVSSVCAYASLLVSFLRTTTTGSIREHAYLLFSSFFPSRPNVSQRNGHCGENLFQMATTTWPETDHRQRKLISAGKFPRTDLYHCCDSLVGLILVAKKSFYWSLIPSHEIIFESWSTIQFCCPEGCMEQEWWMILFTDSCIPLNYEVRIWRSRWKISQHH